MADVAYQIARRTGFRAALAPSVSVRWALGVPGRLLQDGEDDSAMRIAAATLYVGFVPLAAAAELLDGAVDRAPVLFGATTALLLVQTAVVVFGRGLRAWVWGALTFAVPMCFVAYTACTPSAGLLLWPALTAPVLWTALFRSGGWLVTDYLLVALATGYAAHVYPDASSPLVGPAADAIRLLALAVVAIGVFHLARVRRLESRQTGNRERRQRKLVEHLLYAHEQEREQIAAHLHDETVQTLTAGVFALGAASQAHARGDGEVTTVRLEQATTALRSALDDARRMSFQLRPVLISHYAICEAVQRMVDQFAADTGVTVHFDVDSIPSGLDRLVETLVYRTLADLLDNVRLHAHADEVTIRVGRTDQVLWGEVSDDGSGFAIRPAIGKRRTLASMAEQFRAAGGYFRIATGETGSTIAFQFPLDAPP
jgi:signal transduction histidine kinase